MKLQNGHWSSIMIGNISISNAFNNKKKLHLNETLINLHAALLFASGYFFMRLPEDQDQSGF